MPKRKLPKFLQYFTRQSRDGEWVTCPKCIGRGTVVWDWQWETCPRCTGQHGNSVRGGSVHYSTLTEEEIAAAKRIHDILAKRAKCASSY